MRYRKFHLYLSTGVPLSIQKSFELFNLFLNRLSNNNIAYPNFNNYSGPNNRVTIRADMDYDATQIGTSLVKEFMQDGRIIGYKIKQTTTETYIKAAHELASKIAREIFNNHLNNYNDEIQRGDFPNGLLYFMMYFIKSILKKIGYTLYISWDIERHYLGSSHNINRTRVLSIADSCEDLIINNRVNFSNPDFFERFIHLFMNCMLITEVKIKQGDREGWFNVENSFWSHMSRVNTIKTICTSIDND